MSAFSLKYSTYFFLMFQFDSCILVLYAEVQWVTTVSIFRNIWPEFNHFIQKVISKSLKEKKIMASLVKLLIIVCSIQRLYLNCTFFDHSVDISDHMSSERQYAYRYYHILQNFCFRKVSLPSLRELQIRWTAHIYFSNR